MPRDCADSDIPGERPHPAVGDSPRCGFHRRQREKWTDRNRKARQRGNRIAPLGWEEYVRPRPERRRGTEVTAEEAVNIRDCVAAVAVAKAPLDSARDHGLAAVPVREVDDLAVAINDLLDALRPLTRRPD